MNSQPTPGELRERLKAGEDHVPTKESVAPEQERTSRLSEHLLALRKTLIVCFAALIAAFFGVFYFLIEPLMQWIMEPIQARGIEIIYTAMSEALVTKFKVALIAAAVVASPVIVWQVWSFIRPALYAREKKSFRLLFFIALLLFLAGVSFCYFAVYTLALDFFLVQGEGLARPMLSIDKYVSFLFGFIVPFGIAFQLPVFLYLAARMGWTTGRSLASKRKYVLLGVFVLAAVLTPPDVVSQVCLGVPLYLLYEVSILVARMTRPRRRDDEQQDI